jgi:mitochondrial ornithine carrier protein
MNALLVCGAISGAFTSIFLTPIELIKCKMQVPLDTSTAIRHHSPFRIISSIYQHQGIAGFWRGQLGTLIRETGGCIAWFGGNESMKRFFRTRRNVKVDDPLPVHELMTAGAIAGMSYNFVFFPADTIKSQMQTDDVRVKGGKRTFWSVGKALYRQQGLQGLYRGCGITVARAAPSSAVIFTVFEALKTNFA